MSFVEEQFECAVSQKTGIVMEVDHFGKGKGRRVCLGGVAVSR